MEDYLNKYAVSSKWVTQKILNGIKKRGNVQAMLRSRYSSLPAGSYKDLKVSEVVGRVNSDALKVQNVSKSVVRNMGDFTVNARQLPSHLRPAHVNAVNILQGGKPMIGLNTQNIKF